MLNYYNEILRKLEDGIESLSVESDNSISLIEIAVELIIKSLEDLKQFVLKRGFETDDEEIHFFKRLKPLVLSKLIYYNAIYKIETKKPYGGDKITKKYLSRELNKLKRFFDNNLEFYKYYRTNSNYLDHKYFLRGKHDIKLSLDTFYFETDHQFSTSHDYLVAKIVANDLIQLYLEDQLTFIRSDVAAKSSGPGVLKWTESKSALTELVYALHTKGVFDNGKTDIKIIAESFENMFGIDLGDIYHIYFELRNRKVSRTKFLDSIKESLIRKMDEQEERME